MKRKLLLGLVLSALFPILVCVMMAAILEDDTPNQPNHEITIGLSAEVLAYRPLAERYCNEFGIPDCVNYILAIMQVESGGLGNDVMQCSESLGLPPNTLLPEASVRQGCLYFSQAKSYAESKGCDIWTAVQGYNFGITGYVNFIAEHGGLYTIALSESYSRDVVAPSLGNTTGEKYGYSDPIAVAYNGGFLYRNGGNFFYAEKVKSYLVTTVTGEFVQTVMNEALKYQGYPYTYGGTPPASFDCSALTQWCYKAAGVNLPRTAQAQYEAMQHISLEQAKPGDLLFFQGTYSTSDYITHTGIYVGNGQMYHAGNPIGYTNINTSYWQEHFVCAGTVQP